MRLNRWLPIAIALVGICNVEVVGRWYLLNRLVTQPLNDYGGTSPLAIGLQHIDAELRSRQIIVTPEAKAASIKNAVTFALSSVNDKSRASQVQIDVSRDMFQKTVSVFVVQLALALAIPALLTRRNRSGPPAA
jgi:hypothetical protein